jgi:hypothetical protein
MILADCLHFVAVTVIGKPQHSFPTMGFNEAVGITKRFILIDAIDFIQINSQPSNVSCET